MEQWFRLADARHDPPQDQRSGVADTATPHAITLALRATAASCSAVGDAFIIVAGGLSPRTPSDPPRCPLSTRHLLATYSPSTRHTSATSPPPLSKPRSVQLHPSPPSLSGRFTRGLRRHARRRGRCCSASWTPRCRRDVISLECCAMRIWRLVCATQLPVCWWGLADGALRR